MEQPTEESPTITDEFADKRDELTEFLRARLIDCGWRDQVASMCRVVIQNRGVENVKLAHIVSEVKAEARQKVPANVLNEVLGKLRRLAQESQ